MVPCRMGWSGAMWQQQQQHVSAAQPSTRGFFQRVLEGGDRAGLSMDAQKRTKTEWEYEDMCGGKKRASGQVRIQDQGGGWVGANGFWDPRALLSKSGRKQAV